MAVGFDASSESHTASTGSTSAASFTWNHAGAASGVAGILVFTFEWANADDALSVTYNGITVPAVAGALAADTVTEPGRCKAWFLGSGVPQGTNAVVVNRTNNANVMYAVAITVTASTGRATEAVGVVLLQENAAVSEQNVDDGSPGTNSMRFAGVYSGLATHQAAGANSTELQFFPASAGAQSNSTVRETTAGQGSRPVGFSAGTDDLAAVHLAIRELIDFKPQFYRPRFFRKRLVRSQRKRAL